MFRRTLIPGYTTGYWNTIPILRLRGGRSVTRSSSKKTSPTSGCSRPAIIRIKVVLPQPEGPSRQVTAEFGKVIVTSSTATVSLNSLRRLVQPDLRHAVLPCPSLLPVSAAKTATRRGSTPIVHRPPCAPPLAVGHDRHQRRLAGAQEHHHFGTQVLLQDHLGPAAEQAVRASGRSTTSCGRMATSTFCRSAGRAAPRTHRPGTRRGLASHQISPDADPEDPGQPVRRRDTEQLHGPDMLRPPVDLSTGPVSTTRPPSRTATSSASVSASSGIGGHVRRTSPASSFCICLRSSNSCSRSLKSRPVSGSSSTKMSVGLTMPARQRDPLLLAAAQLIRALAEQVGDLELLGDLPAPSARSRGAESSCSVSG